jgi:hypothetical protein
MPTYWTASDHSTKDLEVAINTDKVEGIKKQGTGYTVFMQSGQEWHLSDMTKEQAVQFLNLCVGADVVTPIYRKQ